MLSLQYLYLFIHRNVIVENFSWICHALASKAVAICPNKFEFVICHWLLHGTNWRKQTEIEKVMLIAGRLTSTVLVHSKVHLIFSPSIRNSQLKWWKKDEWQLDERQIVYQVNTYGNPHVTFFPFLTCVTNTICFTNMW